MHIYNILYLHVYLYILFIYTSHTHIYNTVYMTILPQMNLSTNHTFPQGCEKLVSNFEAKKKARSQEIEALDAKKKALEL